MSVVALLGLGYTYFQEAAMKKYFRFTISVLLCQNSVLIDAGAADPGGPGGPGPPLKLEIYFVKFLEKEKFSFFFLLGPPLEKDRSSAPEYLEWHIHLNNT